MGERTEQPSSCQLRLAVGPAGTDPELRPPATVHVHPAPKTSASIHSLPICLYHPATSPPLLYSFFTANLSCPTPRAPTRPSTPTGRAILTRVLLQPLQRLLLRSSGPRPACTDWRGGELGQPAPALRSRAPSRMGVAWLRPSPQRLTSRLCHPPRPGSMAFDAA